MCTIMGFSKKTLTRQEITPFLERTVSRGPDMSRIIETPSGWLCFQRLAIMGLTEAGMQPFSLDGDMVACNGEIYGFRPLKRQLEERGYRFHSGSDCEVLLPLFREYGLEMFSRLDAEFALVLYDASADSLIAARDPIGIRPLFYGYDRAGAIVFASEAKNLVGLCQEIRPFPPGHYYACGEFVRYADLTTVQSYCKDDLETVCRGIRNRLIAAVDKRLDADAPVGFLLSGGLDSSLVCAISSIVLGKHIRTFAIGMDKDAIDLKYAREAADYYTMWVHQIKTPIAAMGLMLQEDPSQRGRELEAELFRVERYVELVLSYLRLGGGATDYLIREQPLDPILRQAARRYAPLFIRGKVSLELRETELRVLTDEKWLQLVVEQVLSNAVKYTPGGRVTVWTEGSWLMVEDNGVGVAPEDLPRIFDRGFTGCNGRMDKRATGIGLYLCRQICRRLGHTIAVDSEPGRGTRVTIGLARPYLEVE